MDGVVAIIKTIPSLHPILFVLSEETFVECMGEICCALATERNLPLLKQIVQGPIRFCNLGLNAMCVLQEYVGEMLLLHSTLEYSVTFPVIQELCNFKEGKVDDIMGRMLRQRPNLELFKLWTKDRSSLADLLYCARKVDDDSIFEYVLSLFPFSPTLYNQLQTCYLSVLAQTKCVTSLMKFYHELDNDAKFGILNGLIDADNLEMYKLIIVDIDLVNFQWLFERALQRNSVKVAKYLMDNPKVSFDGADLLYHAVYCKDLFHEIRLRVPTVVDWCEVARFQTYYVRNQKLTDVDPAVLDFVCEQITDVNRRDDLLETWLKVSFPRKDVNPQFFAVLAKYSPGLFLENFPALMDPKTVRSALKYLKGQIVPNELFTVQEVQEMIELGEISPQQYHEELKFYQPTLSDAIVRAISLQRVT